MDGIDIDMLCLLVWADEWVEKQDFTIDLKSEAGMSEVSDFHIVNKWSIDFSSVWSLISKDKKWSLLVPLKIQGIAQFNEQGALKLLTVLSIVGIN